MQASQNGPATRLDGFGRQPFAATAEFDEAPAARRRRVRIIDTLTAAAARLRPEPAALDGDRRRPIASEDDAPTEFRFKVDLRAPAAARAAVTGALRGRVPVTMLLTAELVVSELASNSVLHSGASPEQEFVLRVRLVGAVARVEVQDPGFEDAVAPRAPDMHRRGGAGLNLVAALSQRWGVDRSAGGTRVWALLAPAAT